MTTSVLTAVSLISLSSYCFYSHVSVIKKNCLKCFVQVNDMSFLIHRILAFISFPAKFMVEKIKWYFSIRVLIVFDFDATNYTFHNSNVRMMLWPQKSSSISVSITVYRFYTHQHLFNTCIVLLCFILIHSSFMNK